jgi:hypothetical protein
LLLCKRKHLERDAVVLTVLKEDAAIDKSFVQVVLLESSIGNIIGTSRLLEHTDLVLSLSTQVASNRLGSDLERLGTLGIVGLDGAVTVSYALLSVVCDDNVLLAKVESNGKVLPLALDHRSLPEQLHLLVKQLPGLGGVVLANNGTSLELELVSRIIGLFVPDVLLLLEPGENKRLR